MYSRGFFVSCPMGDTKDGVNNFLGSKTFFGKTLALPPIFFTIIP